MTNFTDRQQRFIEAAATAESYADAARQAGYKPSRAPVTGSELMARPEIAQAVQKRRAQVLREAGYDPVDSVRRLMAIASDETNDPRDRVRAEELLLKLARMFEDEGDLHQHVHLDLSVERLLELEAVFAGTEPAP